MSPSSPPSSVDRDLGQGPPGAPLQNSNFLRVLSTWHTANNRTVRLRETVRVYTEVPTYTEGSTGGRVVRSYLSGARVDRVPLRLEPTETASRSSRGLGRVTDSRTPVVDIALSPAHSETREPETETEREEWTGEPPTVQVLPGSMEDSREGVPYRP